MNKTSTNVILDTVIISTTRIEELAEFYRKGFQLSEPENHDNHRGFQLPGTYLGFDRVDKAASHPGSVSLWFAVDDLNAVFEQFVKLGADVKYPPTKKPWGDTLAAVFDPDGNIIGLVQR